MADRIRAAAVANMTGHSVRRIQELSAAGLVPGAARLGGPRGMWTFDPAAIARWIKQEERKAWPGLLAAPTYTNEARPGGDVLSLPDESIAARYEQLIGGKRRGGSKRGASSLSGRP